MHSPHTDDPPSGFTSEHLLLVLVELSPAVLTETVFALCTQPEPDIPDRILVITTQTGRALLEDRLFSKNGWEQLKAELLSTHGLCLDNKLHFSYIDDCLRVVPNATRSQNLTDIRTDSDNLAVADYLMETLRGLCEDIDLRITASIAGGRKTMGALLLSVMSLLGRFTDRVVHVVASEPWERQPEFLFPGCTGHFVDPENNEVLDSRTAKVSLVEVPFLPLRYVFEKEIGRGAGNFNRLIRQLRHRAAGLETEIEIKVAVSSGRVEVNKIQLNLSPREFAFYATLCEAASKGLQPFHQYADIEDPMHALINRHFEPSDFRHWTHVCREADSDPKEDFRKFASKIRARLREAGFDSLQVDRLVPHRQRISVDVASSQIEIIHDQQPLL